MGISLTLLPVSQPPSHKWGEERGKVGGLESLGACGHLQRPCKPSFSGLSGELRERREGCKRRVKGSNLEAAFNSECHSGNLITRRVCTSVLRGRDPVLQRSKVQTHFR